MTTTRRIATLITMLAAIGLAAVTFSSNAGAYPPGTAPTLSVGTTTPVAGGSLTVGGTGLGSNLPGTITLHSAVVTLGSFTTDSSGSFTATVTIPSDVSGTHTLVAATSVASTSITLNIGGTAPPNGGGKPGGIAFTGAAVIGVGFLGVALLVGGGILLFAGRRRKVSA